MLMREYVCVAQDWELWAHIWKTRFASTSLAQWIFKVQKCAPGWFPTNPGEAAFALAECDQGTARRTTAPRSRGRSTKDLVTKEREAAA